MTASLQIITSQAVMEVTSPIRKGWIRSMKSKLKVIALVITACSHLPKI